MTRGWVSSVFFFFVIGYQYQLYLGLKTYAILYIFFFFSFFPANDQTCLDRLYNIRERTKRTIKVLSHIDTYYYIGGAENAWITHWFGGNKDMSTVGDTIIQDAYTAVSQQVYETLQPKIQVWVKFLFPICIQT